MKNSLIRWLPSVVVVLSGQVALAGHGSCTDLDGDDQVGLADLFALLAAWGPIPTPDPPDFNGDGTADEVDLALLLDCWGPCPCEYPTVAEIFDTTEIVTVGAAAGGLTVTHVYATGSYVSVGDALLLSTAVILTPSNATFYQDINGGNVPPPAFLCNALPTVCDDTFVTMNLLLDDSNTVLAAPFFSMDTTSISGSWFTSPDGTEREAVDISGLTGNPGQAGVLVAQVTLSPLGPGPSGYSGTVRYHASGAGGGGALSTVTYPAPAPAPACPWDCAAPANGVVDAVDFYQLIGEWGLIGTPCDFGLGLPGVDSVDFFELIGNWGDCPPQNDDDHHRRRR